MSDYDSTVNIYAEDGIQHDFSVTLNIKQNEQKRTKLMDFLCSGIIIVCLEFHVGLSQYDLSSLLSNTSFVWWWGL